MREKQSRNDLDETMPLNDVSTSIRIDNNIVQERTDRRQAKPVATI